MFRQPAILLPSVKFLVAYSTLDFTRSPLAGKGTWCLLPITPSMLPTATKHFDRVGQYHNGTYWSGSLGHTTRKYGCSIIVNVLFLLLKKLRNITLKSTNSTNLYSKKCVDAVNYQACPSMMFCRVILVVSCLLNETLCFSIYKLTLKSRSSFMTQAPDFCLAIRLLLISNEG